MYRTRFVPRMVRYSRQSPFFQQRTQLTNQYTVDEIETGFRMVQMIRAFRFRGHFAASLDPLSSIQDQLPDKTHRFERKLAWLPSDKSKHPDVLRFLRSANGHGEHDFSIFHLDNIPRDKLFYMGNEFKVTNKFNWTLNELVSCLKDAYCGSVGVESSHIENDIHRKWLQEKVEGEYGPNKWNMATPAQQLRSLRRLLRSDHTALYLGEKFKFAKIFGIEGCESLVPGLMAMLEEAASSGTEAVEFGMTHRGRLNLLHNVFGKKLRSICNKFNENDNQHGDIKFHLGTRSEVTLEDTHGAERKLQLSLCANPSHLEAVYPVVIGVTRAKQFYIGDTDRSRVVPIVLHGDASFSGQGIVSETMELAALPDYTVGGCVHIIVNNQIGFTTDANLARTSYHCTNAAKRIEAPIFHVNGDDVDAVTSVCRLAMQYRQKFKRDVVVDIVCYRRNGHTSKEDPRITQPLTYRIIENHPTTLTLYKRKLIDLGLISEAEVAEMSKRVYEEYDLDYKASKEYKPDPLEWMGSSWQGAAIGSLVSDRPYNPTGVLMEILHVVGKSLCYVPDHIVVHKDVQAIIDARKVMLETGEGITMGFAEALAIGALMTPFYPGQHFGTKGIAIQDRNLAHADDVLGIKLVKHPTVHVRLSGQDCIRGTFNQRHAAIMCQETGKQYWQLNNLFCEEQATLQVCNSSLSEAAVLAFEYGYSLENDLALTMWEAQFGDFANVAQHIIDNFIVAGEAKWKNTSALVLLLPHGYDGQGPEHSSGRVERFLQLVDDDESDIPGLGLFNMDEIRSGFEALDVSKDGVVQRHELVTAIAQLLHISNTLRIERALSELMFEHGYSDDVDITLDVWTKLMMAWLQYNSERTCNMSVVSPSTPAQYFHALRRQVHRSYAKPLVVMSSKYLLHHKPCVSSLKELGPGTIFLRVIAEGERGDNLNYKFEKFELEPPEKIKRVIFCTGKRNGKKIRDIALVRVEQLAPFPYDLITPIIQRHPNAELVWVQEEPKNMGAWTYVRPRFETCLREKRCAQSTIRYVGRRPSAAPATGAFRVHMQEEKAVLEWALGEDKEKYPVEMEEE